MSYAVGSRVREFGVRLALGAVPRHVVGTAVTEGVVVAGVGISLGVVGALAATRLLQAFLYEVSPTDPATFLVVIAAVSTVAILATWVPARRAGMVDIIDALRKD